MLLIYLVLFKLESEITITLSGDIVLIFFKCDIFELSLLVISVTS